MFKVSKMKTWFIHLSFLLFFLLEHFMCWHWKRQSSGGTKKKGGEKKYYYFIDFRCEFFFLLRDYIEYIAFKSLKKIGLYTSEESGFFYSRVCVYEWIKCSKECEHTGTCWKCAKCKSAFFTFCMFVCLYLYLCVYAHRLI